MPYIILGLSAFIAVVDQIIKYFIVTDLKPISRVDVIPNLFSLIYVENRGAAFGMLENSRWIFIVFTILVTLFFIFLVFSGKIKNKLFDVAAVLVIGGGIGNLIDRIFLGYVVDYLSISFFPPVCNFADYCITVGVALLAVYIIFYYGKEEKLKGKTNG